MSTAAAVAAPRLLGRWRAVHVAAVVLAVHLAWVAAFFAGGHDVHDLVRIGPHYVQKSDASDVIRYDPTLDYPENRDADRPGEGYDGQFFYYLALDPANARHYMDFDGYRYLRPLYPALARALAGGSAELVPWTLLAINLLAVALGTLLLARWLERRSQPPWLAFLYGFSPGLLVAVQRDLSEPLAYALVIGAVVMLERGWVRAAALLALAGLARQTTLVFVPVFALALLFRGDGPLRARARRNLGAAAAFSAIGLVPYLVYSAAIGAWLGDTAGGENFSAFPLAGLFAGELEPARHGVTLLTVAVPVLIWMWLAAVLIRRRLEWVAPLAVLMNGFLFLVMKVDSNAYTARGRAVIGVALALVLCLPALRTLEGRPRRLLIASAALWLAMLPVVAVYGLSDVRV